MQGTPLAAVAPSPYERMLLLPLVVVAVMYNALQLVPTSWLPSRATAVLSGYESDIFLLLQRPTTLSTLVLREALAPDGRLGRTWIVRSWRAR